MLSRSGAVGTSTLAYFLSTNVTGKTPSWVTVRIRAVATSRSVPGVMTSPPDPSESITTPRTMKFGAMRVTIVSAAALAEPVTRSTSQLQLVDALPAKNGQRQQAKGRQTAQEPQLFHFFSLLETHNAQFTWNSRVSF